MGTIRESWSVVKESWSVLKRDRSLAFFPILSSISAIIMVLLVFGPFSGALISETATDDPSQALLAALGLAAAYLATFSTIFFNVALVACARRSFEGEDTKVSEGISAAMQRLPQIATWAAVSLTVGLILRALDSLADRAPFPVNLLANIGVWILGGVWSVMTYLVVPVVAYEGIGGLAAVSRSRDIISGRWGKGVIGNVAIGLIAFVIGMLPGGALMYFGAMAWADSAAMGFTLVACGAGIVLLAMVISSTLTQIFNAALYGHMTGGTTPRDFSPHTLNGAFRAR